MFIYKLGAMHSQQLEELQNAQIRSHAASVAHQRRRSSKASTTSLSSVTSLTSRFSYAHLNKNAKCSPQEADNNAPEFMDSHLPEPANPRIPPFSEVDSPREKPSARMIRDSIHKHANRYHSECARFRVVNPNYARKISASPGFGCYRAEVFMDMPNGHERNVREVVDFYLAVINPGNDLITEVFDVQNVYHKWVAFMSNNSIYYHAGLSSVAALWGRSTGGSPVPPSFVLTHQGKALAIVRQNLSRDDLSISSLPRGLMITIMSLAVVEGAVGNIAGVLHHLQALKKIVDGVGGRLNLLPDDYFPETATVMQFDAIFALTGLPSAFVNDRRPWRKVYVSSPFSETMLRTLARLPSGFRELILETKLTTDTVDILERAIEKSICDNNAAQARIREARRYEPRKHEDIICACPIFAEPDDSECLFEKMLCMSLKIFCSINVDTTRSNLISLESNLKFMTSRLPTVCTTTLAEDRCRVWMYLVTIDGYRDGYKRRHVSTTGLTLLAEVTKLLPKLAITSWEALEGLLNSFFWTKGFSEFWRDRWDQIVYT